jgi:hypothetical protein
MVFLGGCEIEMVQERARHCRGGRSEEPVHKQKCIPCQNNPTREVESSWAGQFDAVMDLDYLILHFWFLFHSCIPNINVGRGGGPDL